VKSVCVFCGSSTGADPAYREAGRDFGRRLAGRGLGLVFGGGHVGIMGAVADGALEAGGRVTGVIPAAMVEKELAHPGLTECVVVRTMHERKALMNARSDAFVALPGGIGTLDELFEAWTWAQLGVHRKPVALLDVAGFWGPLVALADHMAGRGFLPDDSRDLLLCHGDPERLLDLLAAWRAPVRTLRWETPET
jgi:uncharacterized protein (TIGR00730 family)